MLRFRVFGSVGVTRGDGTGIRLARRERQLLACLLVREDHVATTDELVDGIWGDDVPSNPRNSLQVLVKRVRTSLGESGRALIVNVGDGYGLAMDHRSSDVGIFRRLFQAALALRGAESDLSRRLFDRCLEVSTGDLPDFHPVSRASEDVWELHGRRDEAAQYAAHIAASPLITGRAWGSDEQIVMVLRLAEVDEVSLADAVIAASLPLGGVQSFSKGTLVVGFREAGAGVRAAKRVEEALAGDPALLLGGAVGRISTHGEHARRVTQAASTALPGQILVLPAVAAAAATAAVEVQLLESGPDMWQIGSGRERHDGVRGARSPAAFVGRQADIDAVTTLLSSGTLTTIRGPGGIGKSRLAREVTHRIPDGLVDQATVIDLAGADSRVGGALGIVALGLGILAEPFRPLMSTVVDRLSGSSRLLLLDNCEDALDDVRSLCVALRDSCSRVRVLATSRAALGAGHEQLHDLDRLDRPGTSQLLVSLAGDASGIRAPMGAALQRVCDLVDGMPLAAECAAALLRQLGPAATVVALSEVPDGAILPLLDAAHGGLGRHRSVEAALSASVGQLDDPDRRVFERLSSVRGRFNREDASVAAPVEGFDVVPVLGRLRDASLLKQDGPDAWSMLEPVRQFAATRLLREGKQSAQAALHCAYFVRSAERHEHRLRSPDEADAFARLNRSYPNLTAALAWAVHAHDGESALRIASALWWWWAAQGMFVEGAAELDRALAISDDAPPELRAKALIARSHLAWWAGNPRGTAQDCALALQLVAGMDGPTVSWCRAWAHMSYAAAVMWGGGRSADLGRRLDAAEALLRSLGDHTGCGIALEVYSGLAWHDGEYELGVVKGAAALEQFEAGGHQTMIAQGRRVVGVAYGVLGDVDRGTEMIADGLRLSESIGDAGGMPLGLCLAGLVHTYATRADEADAAFLTSLRHNRERGQLWAALLALAHAGVRAVKTDRPHDGIRLLTVAEGITARSSIGLAPRERAVVADACLLAARMLDDSSLRAAQTDGDQLGVAEAMTLGIDVLSR